MSLIKEKGTYIVLWNSQNSEWKPVPKNHSIVAQLHLKGISVDHPV